MQTRNEAVRPRAYWWIAVLALAWNLIGLAMFFAQAMLDGEQVLQLPEAQRAVHLATPGWVNLAFAFAVIGGILRGLPELQPVALPDRQARHGLADLHWGGIRAECIGGAVGEGEAGCRWLWVGVECVSFTLVRLYTHVHASRNSPLTRE